MNEPLKEFETVVKAVIHKDGEELAGVLPSASYGAGITLELNHEVVNDRVALIIQAAAVLVLQELNDLFTAFDGVVDNEESQRGFEHARIALARYHVLAFGDKEWLTDEKGGIV